MDSIKISCIVLGVIFGGAIIGLLIRRRLPQHHLSTESKDIVKLGTGLIGTMAALVLGLLVSTTKSAYDAQRDEVVQMSANAVWLGRLLGHYGAEAQSARELLKEGVAHFIEQIWSREYPQLTETLPASSTGDRMFEAIEQLSPASEAQRSMKAEAIAICTSLGRTRALLSQQASSSLSVPFLVVVVFWITIIFVSFGLFAPSNATVVVTLFVCALSVAGAIFLILELTHPFSGMIQISSAPMKHALLQLSH